MNEEINEVAAEEAQTEEVFDGGITEEEFDAIWESDDDDFTVEEAEADQPEAEPAEEPQPEEPEPEQPQEDADQYLELKHFDEVRKVTKEEAKTLAQKGMDYDRIRGKLNDAEAAIQKLQQYEAFLNEMKGDFGTIDDLIIDSKARVVSDRDNISYEEAVSKVRAAMQPQPPQQQQLSPEDVKEAMRRESLTAFLQEYPDVKAKDIPQEVWDDMKVTNNLVASYAKYEAKKIASENEILKQNAKNKARSVGSMKSSGKSYNDDIDRMWYEDDD